VSPLATTTPSTAPEPPAQPDLGERWRNQPVPTARGWRGPGGGRAANLFAGAVYQATTVQACGLFPFAVSSGAVPAGVPIGRHQLTAEPIGMDLAEWLKIGLVTNTACWVQAQPGAGKSALVKRMITGLVAFGMTAVIPGDLKGEYSPLVAHLGGHVWRLGQGLHALNPLDASFLQEALDQSVGTERYRLAETIRSRRCALVEALVSIVRKTYDASDTTERLLLARALDVTVRGHQRTGTEPTIPDIVRVLANPTQELRDVLVVEDDRAFLRESRDLRNSLQYLCDGPIRGMFDRPSSVRADLTTRALSLDLQALGSDASDDVVAASMLSSWAWVAAVIDASTAIGRQRTVFRVQDELWKALRAAPGLVDRSDEVTRLGRHRGEVSVQITHSLDDLEALPTEADRAKARGMVSRSDTVVLGGLAHSELDKLSRIVRLTSQEAEMITKWAAPPGWKRAEGMPHPGRGKYMIKSGEKLGLPVEMTLTNTEWQLYDTDLAWREQQSEAS
jgi:hypothetical protein